MLQTKNKKPRKGDEDFFMMQNKSQFVDDLSELPVSHGWLIKRMKIFFPEDLIDEGGVCNGVSHMGMQAILTRDLAFFDKRLRLMYTPLILKIISDRKNLLTKVIATIQQTELIDKKKEEEIIKQFANRADLKQKFEANQRSVKKMIELNKIKAEEEQQKLNELNTKTCINAYLQQKINGKIANLPEDDRLLLELETFFNGILLYQDIELFPELDDKTRDRFKLKTSLLTSVKLEAEGGIHKVNEACFSGVYSHGDLTQLLKSFQDDIDPEIKQPIAFLLGTINHAITIGYDPQNLCWYLIDANSLPSKTISDPKILAQSIIDAFKFEDKSIDQYVTMSFEPCVTESNELGKTYLKTWTKSKDWKAVHNTFNFKKSKYVNDHFMLAISLGDTRMVKSLLRDNANINYTKDTGQTPLFLAIKDGHLDIVEILFNNATIDVNKPGTKSYDTTPLLLAARYGRLDIFKFLLSKNAVLQDQAGNTAFFDAIKYGLGADVADWLIQNGMVTKAEIDHGQTIKGGYYTPLFLAIQNGLDALIVKILETGANVNLTCGKDNETPLMFAAEKGNMTIVKKMLEYGATVNQKDINGETVLHHAIRNGHMEVVALLIKQNPQLIEIKNNNQETPLYFAKGRLAQTKGKDSEAVLYTHLEEIIKLISQASTDKATAELSIAKAKNLENIKREDVSNLVSLGITKRKQEISDKTISEIPEWKRQEQLIEQKKAEQKKQGQIKPVQKQAEPVEKKPRIKR